MAVFTGSATVTSGSPTVTVSGFTLSPLAIFAGATVSLGGAAYFLASVVNTTTLTLTRNYVGPSGSVPLEINTISENETDIVTLNVRTADLIEDLLSWDSLGNLASISPLTGSGVIMQDATGAHSLMPKADLISGADYDVQVNALADRAAYDTRPANYRVLVSDTGDGRSAIYSKLSATSGDWSAPAYVTGPVGPISIVEAGTTTTLPPGSAATVTDNPIPGGISLDFGIPAGEGFAYRGDYSGATAYVKGDVVLNNDSSWIALQATTGNAPPVLPVISNAYWSLLARAGVDGTGTVTSIVAGDGITVDNTDPENPVISADATGTGDVVGPAGAVADRIAVFDGTTGKLIKDGGRTIGSLYSTVIIQTTNYTIAPADNGKVVLCVDTSSNITITLPSAASVGNGFKVIVKKSNISTTTTTISGGSIDGGASKVLRTPNQSVALICDGTAWRVMSEGSLFDSGSNANGTYSRFADGTQICVSQNIPGVATDVPAASLFTGAEGEWTFPAAFSAPPALTPLLVERTSAAGSGHAWARNSLFTTTTTNGMIGLLATAAIFVGTVRGVANGRWYA